jgi:hypothetical protein
MMQGKQAKIVSPTQERAILGGSVAKFDFWAKSKNLVSGIQ